MTRQRNDARLTDATWVGRTKVNFERPIASGL